KITGPNPEQRLKDYVLRHFLNTSHWTYPDGDSGGFTFKQMLYCAGDGTVGRYPDDQLTRVQDWNKIGPDYRWSLFTCYLHDFVAGARPKKVFDFGDMIPDPLYGTAGALQFMSLGMFNAQGFHDFMDLQMSTQHSRVHQALMEGSSKVFAAWIKDN